MLIFAAMKGKNLFEQYTAEYSVYGKLLMSLHLILGEQFVFDMLEKAEAAGKKLAIKESSTNNLDDDITVDSIILV